MKSEKYEEVAPSTSLVESVRNFGYDLNTAISDLIDNSISANARKIEITLLFEESEPCVLNIALDQFKWGGSKPATTSA